MAKREMPSKTRFILAAIYGTCAAVWLGVGFAGNGMNNYAFVLSLVWAALTTMWVATGIQQRKIEGLRIHPVPEESPTQQRSFLSQGERAAAVLHRLGESMQNPTARAQTAQLEGTTRNILAQLVLYPEKQPLVRQFLDYYLPASVKILEAYHRMEGSSSPELQSLRDRIEGMLENLCGAFDKQRDALFRDEALDISTDISVMEQMLQQEGFGGAAALNL